LTRLSSFDRVSMLASGPILGERLGLLFGAAWTRGAQLHRAEALPATSAIGSAFAHLLFTPTSDHEVRVFGWAELARSPFPFRVPFKRPDERSSGKAAHAQAIWERQSEAQIPWRVAASYTGVERDDGPPASTAVPVFERLIDGPVSALASLASETTRQWSLSGRLAPSKAAVRAAHMFDLGAEAQGSRLESTNFFTGPTGERVDGIAARVWRFSHPEGVSIRDQTIVAAYAGDRVSLGSRATLGAALRFESITARAKGAATGISWRSWLPKASLRVPLTRSWHADLVAGFSRAGDRLLLDTLAVGDPAAPTAGVHRWTSSDRFGNPLVPLGPPIANMGPGTGGNPAFSRIDDGLKRPYTDELVVGVEAKPRDDVRLRLVGIAREERRLLTVTNVGVPESAYTSFLVADPGSDVLNPRDDRAVVVYNRRPASFGLDRYLLTNSEDEAATLRGLEFSAELYKPRLTLIFGATAGIAQASAAGRGIGPTENDQGLLGELAITPNAATFARGRPFTDRAYTIKLAGVLRLPSDVRVGAIARYQDGQPFARMLVFPDLSQGAEAVRAFASGDSRFRFTGTLDLRVQKGFAAAGARLAAVLDAYNVLGLRYDVEEVLTAPPDVRIPTAVQPPRAIHLGAKLTF
jgi:hypothetical protein